ncbi:MAG: 4-carboxy-4-hydroxy-2-oxoadipate aldolase/oxaloacetate decarboxylase [Burkholderiaceae bacterium]|nr:4-carboxy-4-hydroxy-2-oxoadipate aldolase/oxaloacetate decarboxylase [Burkholderiaceae bacterium]
MIQPQDDFQRHAASALRLGAATLHEALGQRGAIDPAIKPLDPSMRVFGRAFTVHCPNGDNLMIHHALTKARPGDVLVVDAGGYMGAGPWGDILTLAARTLGLGGLLIDGAVRDSTEIVQSGFPVFARGICLKGTSKCKAGSVGEPIACGGVLIHPGDLVVGDRDGVVVIPQSEVDRTIDFAERRARAEESMRHAVLAGRTTVDLLGLGPRLNEMGYGRPEADGGGMPGARETEA